MISAQNQTKSKTKNIYKLGILGSILGLTLALGLIVLPKHLLAQETPANEDQVTLTAIPPRLGDDNTLVLKPGEKKQVQIRVRNSSDRSLPILSQATDFIIGEDGETPVPVTEDTSGRWSSAEWLTMVPQGQTLQTQETGMINVLIEVPEDALPGGHYAMITHQPNAEGLSAGESVGAVDSASGISQRVGTLMYLIVEGDINEEAFIREFNIPNFSEYGPVPFSYTVENASDIHITPKTKVEITDMFGRKVDEIVVGEKNVFPMMNRDFEGEWEQVWGYGKYDAQATMSFGTAGKIVVAKTSFWLIPIKLIIAILIVLLTLIAVIITVYRHIAHRRSTQSSKVELLERRLQELEREKLQDFEE